LKALVDGDILCHRCAASAENDPEEIAILRSDNQLREILANTKADTYEIFLSGESNFRYDIYPEYKANRKQEKPRWLQNCREFLVTEHHAKVTEGYEADDAIGISASQDKDNTVVICSDDKDMLQIAGTHYNIRTQKSIFVSLEDALYMFYFQLLVGDSADNIKGCPGIGKVKAERALMVNPDEWLYFEICRDLYNNNEAMLLNGQLLWIWKKENDLWQFPEQPIIELDQEMKSESMQPTVETNGPFTGPTL